MFTKALLATDLSPASQAVVGCVKGLRAVGTRECVLLHCFDVPQVAAFSEEMKEHFLQSMEEQKRMLEEQGFAVTTRAEPGLPHTQVPHIAAEEECSLLVVGSHGHSLGHDIFLGGIASAVVQHATLPVLVLRLTTAEDGQPMCVTGRCEFIEHVLFPTDFSDNAEHAFAYLAKVVESGARKVTLLHVQDRIRLAHHLEHRLDEFNEVDRGRLERMKARLGEMGSAEVNIELSYGLPKAEILQHAQAGKASMVIMGSQGRGYLGELFLGSVSHYVARRAESPVLLVPMLSGEGEAA